MAQSHHQNSAAVKIENVSRRFSGKIVLDGINLEIARRELFGLLGPSGSGKTTLIRLITGIDEADSGSIALLGRRMPNLPMMQRFGYMAQSDALYNELTARENLQFFASLYGLKGEHRNRRISRVMEIVQLSDHLAKPVQAYSGGMKRRLSLAIALLHEPELLVLDEPTVGIDPVLRKSIWQELASLQAAGTTILLTTHVMDEAEKCGRLGLIREGKLIAADTPDNIKRATGSGSIEEAFIRLGEGAAV